MPQGRIPPAGNRLEGRIPMRIPLQMLSGRLQCGALLPNTKAEDRRRKTGSSQYQKGQKKKTWTLRKGEGTTPGTLDLFTDGSATNNEAEYEALIAGLRIAEKMGAQNLQVNVDSKLVANPISEKGSEQKGGCTSKWHLLASTSQQAGARESCVKGKIRERNRSARRSRRRRGFMDDTDRRAKQEFGEGIVQACSGKDNKELVGRDFSLSSAEIGMPTSGQQGRHVPKNDEALEINLGTAREKARASSDKRAKKQRQMEKYLQHQVMKCKFQSRRLGCTENEASV
ncbi:reverse transcriptase domain-containing protein [Tanacetum coccineum]